VQHTPGSRISPKFIPPPTWICILFVYTRLGVGPMGIHSKIIPGDDRVAPYGSPAIKWRDRGNFLPSHISPGIPLASSCNFIPSILSGRMPTHGKSLPWLPPLSDTHPVVIFCPYFLFSLYNHYFIGRFKNHVHKIF